MVNCGGLSVTFQEFIRLHPDMHDARTHSNDLAQDLKLETENEVKFNNSYQSMYRQLKDVYSKIGASNYFAVVGEVYEWFRHEKVGIVVPVGPLLESGNRFVSGRYSFFRDGSWFTQGSMLDRLGFEAEVFSGKGEREHCSVQSLVSRVRLRLGRNPFG